MSVFTEDQKQQLKALNKKYALKSFGLIANCFVMLLFANLLVITADVLYVHSKVFVFIASFASGFLFSKLLLDNFRFLGDNLKTDTLKILEQKSEE